MISYDSAYRDECDMIYMNVIILMMDFINCLRIASVIIKPSNGKLCGQMDDINKCRKLGIDEDLKLTHC